jgi:DNA-binding SARP family transcriptional activator
VEFRILGAIEVVADDGQCLALGGSRSRALLAALLLRPGSAICRDSLIDALWAEPPASASHAVEVYASRLRRAIGKTRIRSQGHAYLVAVDADELDLTRFRALARVGREAALAGRTESAAVTLADALALWRGDPVACLNGEPFAAEARGALAEERFSVVEALLDARLELGLDEELLPELRALVAEHPSRERLWGRLMLALYRSGRQVDALEAYRQLRGRLADELGIEPGPDLHALQRDILRHAPSLRPPAVEQFVSLAT